MSTFNEVSTAGRNMMSTSDAQPPDDPSAIIERFRRSGVLLWLDNGALRYKASKGVLTAQDFAVLKRSREQLIEWLGRFSAGTSLGPVPLTFTQCARWKKHFPGTGEGVRGTARALRLRGRLNVEALRRAVEFLVARHEVLRMRFVLHEGSPMQMARSSMRMELRLHDLMSMTSEEGAERSTRIIEQILTEPVDLAEDPLFTVALLRFSADDHILILAMEHLISDAVSLSVLFQELLDVYEAYATSDVPALPLLPARFLDHARWQRDTHAQWLAAHGEYWDRRSRGYRRVIFPHRKQSTTLGFGTVAIGITPVMTKELREWSRRHRTTLTMTVLTAYAVLILRWCGVFDAVLRCQSDGRDDPKLQHVVGFFASMLHLRTELRGEDTLLDLLRRVSSEYCEARLHADSSWVELHAANQDFLSGPGFNWIPQMPSEVARGAGPEALEISPVDFEQPLLRHASSEDGDPFVEFTERAEGIAGYVYFPLSHHDADEMDRFARSFVSILQQLLSNPETRVDDAELA